MKTLCDFCGEEEGIKKIVNPNLDLNDNINWDNNDNWWIVCRDCEEIIHCQQEIDFNITSLSKIKDNKNRESIEKEIEESNNIINEIAKRTKRPIFSAVISKKKGGKYSVNSIEFTGEK